MRNGTALVVVLAALAVATLLFMAAMKMILIQRKTIELGSRQLQAGLLAESGIQRAAARLAADKDYHGESWKIAAEDLGGRDGGIVTIKVEPVSGKADRRAVDVKADFPPEPDQRARETREVIIKIQAAKSSADSKSAEKEQKK
jgi:type II secretory pathway component PulK